MKGTRSLIRNFLGHILDSQGCKISSCGKGRQNDNVKSTTPLVCCITDYNSNVKNAYILFFFSLSFSLPLLFFFLIKTATRILWKYTLTIIWKLHVYYNTLGWTIWQFTTPNRHTTWKQCRCNIDSTPRNNVDSTLIQREDVESTLFQRCVPAGTITATNCYYLIHKSLNVRKGTFGQRIRTVWSESSLSA